MFQKMCVPLKFMDNRLERNLTAKSLPCVNLTDCFKWQGGPQGVGPLCRAFFYRLPGLGTCISPLKAFIRSIQRLFLIVSYMI